MATIQEKEAVKTLQGDVGALKTDMAVVKTDISYIKQSADKMDKFIDENRRGITFANLLDNKVVTVIIGGMILAGIYTIAKGGGL